MLRGLNRWLEANRWAGDAVIATGLLAVAMLAAASAQDVPGFLMSLLLIVPLYARRSRPRTVLVIVALLCLLQVLVLPDPVVGDVAVPLVVHSATAHIRDRRWGTGALIAGLLGAVLGGFRWQSGSLGSGSGQFVVLVGASAASVVAAYLLGARQRDQRERVEEQLTALQERNRLLAIEKDQRTEVVAAGERARIARELHDIVAHSLSVIIVQADGGAAAVSAAPGSAAQLAPRVLGTIAETSREALTEMRRIVTVLRSGSSDRGESGGEQSGGEDDYAPAPGIPDIAALVTQVSAAGVPVTFERRGLPRALPATTELTVYRVVQESLTNVIKHGGPAASAKVTIDFSDTRVEVAVIDDGRGNSQPADDAGHGLVGMRERVLLQGGNLRAGPEDGGGFAVLAVLPLARHQADTEPLRPRR